MGVAAALKERDGHTEAHRRNPAYDHRDPLRLAAREEGVGHDLLVVVAIRFLLESAEAGNPLQHC